MAVVAGEKHPTYKLVESKNRNKETDEVGKYLLLAELLTDEDEKLVQVTKNAIAHRGLRYSTIETLHETLAGGLFLQKELKARPMVAPTDSTIQSESGDSISHEACAKQKWFFGGQQGRSWLERIKAQFSVAENRVIESFIDELLLENLVQWQSNPGCRKNISTELFQVFSFYYIENKSVQIKHRLYRYSYSSVLTDVNNQWGRISVERSSLPPEVYLPIPASLPKITNEIINNTWTNYFFTGSQMGLIKEKE